MVQKIISQSIFGDRWEWNTKIIELKKIQPTDKCFTFLARSGSMVRIALQML